MVGWAAQHLFPRCIRLVQHGMVDVRALVSHRVALHELGTALEVRSHKYLMASLL
jgi:threonine dehydrogenase-like Zn-dependent dehydrogenase